MKKTLSIILFGALFINLILMHILSGAQKDLHGMAVHVQRIDALQEKLLNQMKPVEQFAKLTVAMQSQLLLSMNNTQKMKALSADIQNKNARMLSEEASIDSLVKGVAMLMPAAAGDSAQFLKNTKELKNLMQDLQKTQNDVLELQTSLLKMAKKRHRLLKKIPDSGFFF